MPPVVIAWAAVAIAVAGAVYAATRDFSAPEPDDVGSKVQKRGTKAPRNVVYGETIVSSVNVYNNVYNRDTQYLTTVHTIGVGPITKILQVYIDESPVFYGDLTGSTANADRNIAIAKLPDERGDLVHDGRDPRSGTFGHNSSYYQTGQMRSDFKDQITSMQLRVGNYEEQYMSQVAAKSDGEWTQNHRGDRVAAIGMVIKRDTGANARIMTARFSLTAKVQGMALYDPRYHLDPSEKAYIHGTEVPEEHRQCGRNPALALLDYLIDDYYGAKIPIEYIDVASFGAVANWCDDNGLYIDAEIDSGRSFGENIQDILTCFQGVLIIENGVLVCKYEDIVVAPAFSFDESNVISLGNVIQKGTASYWNVVEVDYKNRAMDEKGDVFTLPADVDMDPRIMRDGFIRTTKVNLPYTLDGTKYEGVNETTVDGPVKFIANRIYALSDFQGSVEIDVDLEEYPVKIMDVVELTSLPLGWDKKLWRVRSMRKSLQDDSYNIATLTLKEYDDSMYQSQLDGVAGRLRANRDPFAQVLPTNLQFGLTSFIKEGSGIVSWDFANTETSVSFDVEYRLTYGSGKWIRLGRTNEQLWKVQRLKEDFYDFRVRAYHIVSGNSPWVELLSVPIVPGIQLPTVTGLSVDTSSSDFLFTWDDMSNAPVTGSYDLDDPDAAGSASKTVKDWFKYYVVRVYHNDGVSGWDLVHTAYTTDPQYSYPYPLNKSKGLSRLVQIDVQIQTTEGSFSTPVSVIGTNPQIAELPIPTVISSGGSFYIDWGVPSALDFVGTEVHMSDQSDFSPDETTLVANVTGSTFYTHSLNGSSGDKYIRLGFYDVFGQDNIVYSSAILGTATSSIGPAGSSTRFKFKYSLGVPTVSDVNAANPTGWVDDVGDATRGTNEVLYMIMASFDADGNIVTSWTTPVQQESHLSLVQYSANTTGPWDYAYEAGADLYYRSSNDGGQTWSTAIRFKGESGGYTDIRFKESETVPGIPTGSDPIDWTDSPPANPTYPVWMIRGDKDADGALLSTWSSPMKVTGDNANIEYSVDGINNWHATYTTDDLFMRTRIGTGTWSAPMRFIGEDGVDGANATFVDMRFKESATLPATPTGDEPTGWSDAPPSNPVNPIWMVKGTKEYSGALVGVWSTPVRLTGNTGATGPSGSSVEVQYSIDGSTNWHSTFVTGDKYMRTRVGTGAWSSAMRFAGEDGADGTSIAEYFHVAYSDSADGSVNFNYSDGVYIGTYVSTTQAASTVYSDYSWRQFRGSQGIQGGQGIPGVNGATGQTTYLHVAYADDILGNGFSQSPVGKIYIGTYTDFILTDSSDPAQYTWSLLKGASGNYADMRFQQSAAQPTVDQVPEPNGWSDAPPPNPTNAVWMIKATKDATNALVTNWSTPIRITGTNGGADGASIEVEYSVNGTTGWHTTFATGDLYMRQRVGGGAWSDAIKFVGEDGSNGTDGKDGATGPTGPQGPQGIQGANAYFHVAYADNATGSLNFNFADGIYIGTYTDTTATNSANYADYTWRKWRGTDGVDGDQGIPGSDGVDGQTTYLHIAYADDIDGNGFSQDPTGKAFMGTYVDFISQDSSTASDYQWKKYKGDDASYVDMRFYESATKPATPTGTDPAGWTDGPPVSPTNAVWMSKVTRNGDGTLATAWSSPLKVSGQDGAAGDNIQVQYSVDGSTSWHSTYAAADKYMRTRVGTGSWSAAQKFIGENGADANYVDIRFKESAALPATPTGNEPSGWSDVPPSNPTNPVWMSKSTKTYSGTLIGSWSTPIRLTGDTGSQGPSGDSVEVQYSVNGSTSWHSTYVAADKYMRTRVGSGAWSAAQKFIGEDGADAWPLLVQYSINGSSNWHTTFAAGDMYMRQSADNGSNWTSAIRIVGEDGAPGTDGTYLDYRFQRNASTPGTPTGNAPSGWYDSPPTGTTPLWMVTGRKTAAGSLIGVWTTPVRITGDTGPQGPPGQDGADGSNGTNGTNGQDGQRGAGRYEVATSTGAWSDTTANNACPGGRVTGDVVTIYKSSDPAVQNTRSFNGSSWVTFALHIHGSALIDGSLNASAIQAYTTIKSPKIEFIGTSHMRICSAQGFGSSNQFIEWFGPLSLTGGSPNMANVTEAKAITYIKTNGDAYFGGSLSAGILRTSVSNTKKTTYAVNEEAVMIGPFGSNGKTKQVVVSWNYNANYGGSGSCATGYSGPSMGWKLERKIGTGGWSQVSSGTFTGSYDCQNELGNQYTYENAGGSSTYTDNSTSTSDFNYRVIVTSYQRYHATSNVNSQSVSLVSTEE